MSSGPTGSAVTPYGRKNPFPAPIKRRWSLSRPGSGKDTRHLEIDLAGSGLEYSVGDSLGVFARNPLSLVDGLIAALGMDASSPVAGPQGQGMTLREALERVYTINRASRKILAGLLERLPAGEGGERARLEGLIASDPSVAEFLYERDYIDLLREFPSVRFESPEAFLKMLSPIQPRLYSIASSPAAHPGEVHLCVAVVRYETLGRARIGMASGFLGEVAQVGVCEVPVFVQESPKFFLPSEGGRDIIMVGPGTGIAPFRAFLEQRAADGAGGRNWLFFGDQHRATDFLYEEDLTRFQKSGILTRLDLAFSRDQAEKVYVQHRMLEQGAELWKWIQGGAYFYVCGDARRMAKDVHQALIQVAREHGGLAPEAATAYVEETLMKGERRYLRDVY
ncbi:MAG TPA: sulfite reductase subunit alpha [Verrucomicrobiales bacterium]|nr:sulfite reductase subunit alpha [Verrucomicrobiales bacterium]